MWYTRADCESNGSAGPLRHAYLEGFTEPIRFGVHGGIKAFYGIEPDEDVPATLDYIVGAVGG